MADEKCLCESSSVLYFACSGGSNVGQLCNAAAVELTKAGRGKMYCLAGIGGHVPGIIDSAAHADFRVALDGCATACARKALEHAGLRVDKAVALTDLGVHKNLAFVWTEAELTLAMLAASLETPAGR